MFCLVGVPPRRRADGAAYVHYDDFVEGTHIEVYLDGIPPNCELACYEFEMLKAPSDKPIMSVQDLQDLTISVEKPHRRRSGKGWGEETRN